MYNQHKRGMATTRHRSLIEKGRRRAFVRDKGLTHTKEKAKKKETKRQQKPIFTNLKTRIRAHKASSKATRPFLMK